MRICCTGGNGMVGQSIKDFISTFQYDNMSQEQDKHEFVFLNRSLQNEHTVDLTDRVAVLSYFGKTNLIILSIWQPMLVDYYIIYIPGGQPSNGGSGIFVPLGTQQPCSFPVSAL